MIVYKRVQAGDINNILKLFSVIFGRELTEDYYYWKYFNGDDFSSYIGLNDGSIVCHVAYNIKKFQILNDRCLSASRHSSFVIEDWRRKGVYPELVSFSLDCLRKINVSIVQAWPNINNMRSTYNHHDYLPLLQISTLEHSSVGQELVDDFSCKKNINKMDSVSLKKFVNKNDFQDDFYIGIVKDFDYLNSRYLSCPEKKYYVFTPSNNSENSIIFGITIIEGCCYLNILEFNSYGDELFLCLSKFKETVKEFDLKIQAWCSFYDKTNYLQFLRVGFSPSTPVFNTGLYFNGNNEYFSSIDNNLSSYRLSMGDTDVF